MMFTLPCMMRRMVTEALLVSTGFSMVVIFVPVIWDWCSTAESVFVCFSTKGQFCGLRRTVRGWVSKRRVNGDLRSGWNERREGGSSERRGVAQEDQLEGPGVTVQVLEVWKEKKRNRNMRKRKQKFVLIF